MTEVFAFVNYEHPSQLNHVDNRRFVAKHAGKRSYKSKQSSTRRKPVASSVWETAWAWDQHRVILPNEEDTTSKAEDHRGDGRALSELEDKTTTVQNASGIHKYADMSLQLPKVPHRSNAQVFDPFNQTTLPELQRSYRLIQFYMSYTKRCSATTSAVSTALRDTTYLYPMLAYISVVMLRLGMAEDRALPIEYYNIRSYSRIRRVLNNDPLAKNVCLQAMMWMAAAALWCGRSEDTRLHLTGIKALLGREKLADQPGEWLEAISFCDVWAAFGRLRQPIFPSVPDRLYQPLPLRTRDSEQLRLMSSKVINQFDVKFHHLIRLFTDCTYAWIDQSSAFAEDSSLGKVVLMTHQVILQALILLRNSNSEHVDQVTMAMMILLGCMFLIMPTCGAGSFGNGFVPLLHKGVFPTFTLSDLTDLSIDYELIHEALEIWNDNISTICESSPYIDDFEWFIDKMAHPVRVLASDNYDEFPKFLKIYLEQQSTYSINRAAKSSDETYFRLRESLFGSVNAKYLFLRVL